MYKHAFCFLLQKKIVTVGKGKVTTNAVHDSPDTFVGRAFLYFISDIVLWTKPNISLLIRTRFHKHWGRPSARVLYLVRMKDIRLLWMLPGSIRTIFDAHSVIWYYITRTGGGGDSIIMVFLHGQQTLQLAPGTVFFSFCYVESVCGFATEYTWTWWIIICILYSAARRTSIYSYIPTCCCVVCCCTADAVIVCRMTTFFVPVVHRVWFQCFISLHLNTMYFQGTPWQYMWPFWRRLFLSIIHIIHPRYCGHASSQGGP